MSPKKKIHFSSLLKPDNILHKLIPEKENNVLEQAIMLYNKTIEIGIVWAQFQTIWILV